jgi:uncharacterized protein YvpB
MILCLIYNSNLFLVYGGIFLKSFIKISVAAALGVAVACLGLLYYIGYGPVEKVAGALGLAKEVTRSEEVEDTTTSTEKTNTKVADETTGEDIADAEANPEANPNKVTSSVQSDSPSTLSTGEAQQEVLPSEILLDVPLLNQMDAPRLYNGCEVTSLAMMMNYYGVDVSKNELATKITRVPLNFPDGKKGNPNVGFVGNMEDGPGLGVYDEPIYLLAKRYMGSKVANLTKQPFDVLIDKVAKGAPVWVITTTSFGPVAPLDTWTTPQGPVGITFKMHSVVITGYDQDSIYINDPYGFKNRKVNKENFIKAWEQMGSHAIMLGEV